MSDLADFRTGHFTVARYAYALQERVMVITSGATGTIIGRSWSGRLTRKQSGNEYDVQMDDGAIQCHAEASLRREPRVA